MLTIFCGDNTVASRDAYSKSLQILDSNGSFINDKDPAEILDIVISGGSGAHDLFSGRTIYTTTNLVKLLKRKLARNAKAKIRELAGDKNIEIVDWEDSSAYDLGIDKDKFDFVKDHKLASSTFTILPKLKPQNAKNFLSELQILSSHQPIELTMSMTLRHVRTMLMLKSGKVTRESPYMLRIAQSGSNYFSSTQLLELYKRLLRADVNVKTGRGTPLKIKEQLETIVAFLL